MTMSPGGPGEQSRGEAEAWLAAHRAKLVRIALSILKDFEEAEDVVQETLLQFWSQARGREVLNPAAYLARAVTWNAVKRRARRRSDLPLEGAPEPWVQPEDPQRDEASLDPLELERALAGLPLAQQTVLRLRFYMGLSFREIASNLSISINTAASRTRYALANLRRVLAPSRGAPSREPGGRHEQ